MNKLYSLVSTVLLMISITIAAAVIPVHAQSGRLLDLYTQKGGVGPAVPGGNFTLGEVVELSVNLTYNGFPVAGKLVSFTVFNPGGILSAILQGTTNNNGAVTENFTIPFLTASIGEWTVIASADVAEQVVSDSLTFEVTYSVPPHGPIASFVESLETPYVGQAVKFDASSSVPGWDGTNVLPITEYQWDFGDGNLTTTSTPIVFHAYKQTGIFYVKLTVYAPNASPTTDTAPVQRKDVLPAPVTSVGGYSYAVSIENSKAPEPLILYSILIAIALLAFAAVGWKTRLGGRLRSRHNF